MFLPHKNQVSWHCTSNGRAISDGCSLTNAKSAEENCSRGGAGVEFTCPKLRHVQLTGQTMVLTRNQFFAVTCSQRCSGRLGCVGVRCDSVMCIVRVCIRCRGPKHNRTLHLRILTLQSDPSDMTRAQSGTRDAEGPPSNKPLAGGQRSHKSHQSGNQSLMVGPHRRPHRQIHNRNQAFHTHVRKTLPDC